MAASDLGSVKGGASGRRFPVKWDQSTGKVYVQFAGWKDVGKASSPGDAMRRAEAAAFNK